MNMKNIISTYNKVSLTLVMTLVSSTVLADLTGIGYGKDINAAKNNALTALSQNILSNVKSEISSTLEVKDDTFSKTGSKNLKVDSNLLLKGVTYRQLANVGGEMQMLANMDTQAIQQTVKFLQEETTFDIVNLTLGEVDGLQIKNRMLLAMLTSAPNDISQSNSILRQAQLNSVELTKRVTHTIWKPNFQGVPVKLTIDGEVINTTKPIFIAVGRHDYIVLATGYREQEGIINAKAGELLPITFDWIAINERGVQLDIGADLEHITNEDWADILENAGLSEQNSSNIRLRVRVKDYTTGSANYKQHALQLHLAFFDGNKRLKKLTMKKKVFANDGDNGTVQKALAKMLTRALPVLASKTEF